MKLAVITDCSAYLSDKVRSKSNLFILDIPVIIDDVTYVEGKNLTESEFYEKMSLSKKFPTTSQPSVAELEGLLRTLAKVGYTHVIGLFLSKGISGFYQNIQYLTEEFNSLTVVFPDCKITSAPLGMMVENTLCWMGEGYSFEKILKNLDETIQFTKAFIMVHDLNHLVRGGRLSNGSAILGSLLSVKPILYFNDGVIEVYEKIRTEKRAIRRLLEILRDETMGRQYKVTVIHANCPQKAEDLHKLLQSNNVVGDVPIVPFGSVIGTHLGEGSVAFGLSPIIGDGVN